MPRDLEKSAKLVDPRQQVLFSSFRERGPAVAILLVGLAITFGLWKINREAVDERMTQEFNALAREVTEHVQERMSGFEGALHASRAFIVAARNITRVDWLTFQAAQKLDMHGSLGVGLAQVVRHEDLARFVEQTRRREYASFHVWPEGKRPVYAPIRFSASLNLDPAPLGRDMYAEPERRTTMERARDTGKAALTDVVTFVPTAKGEYREGMLLYLPVYKGSLSSAKATAAERQATLQSYVYCPLILGEFLQEIEKEVARRKVAVRISGVDDKTLLESSGFSAKRAGILTTSYDEVDTYGQNPDAAPEVAGPLTATHEIDMYGQKWTVRYHPLPGLVDATGGGRPTSIAIIGTIISLLLFWIVWMITSTRLRAERLATQMTRDLRESEERFKSLTKLSADWYWEQDENHRFTAQSGGGQGWSTSAIVNVRGKTRWELPVVGMTDKDWEAHRTTLAARLPYHDFRFKRFDDSGVLRHISVSGEPVFDENGEFKGYRGIGRDVTDQVLAEEKVQYLAYNDSLTGLPNRSNFSLLLNHAIKRARRQKRGLAVLFVDLDRFKVINDTLGHDAGDALLKEVAQRLKRAVRQNDTIARWGGDEFVILLEDTSEPADVAAIAGKLLADVMSSTQILAGEFRVTPSIGISVYPRDGEDEATLIKNADLAMYQAKERGRDNYQFYLPQLNEETALRVKLETSLRGALDRKEFVLHYQPKASLTDGMVSGTEALLRWQPSESELNSPARFIPMLESTGLIVPVGEWVLHTVCDQMRAWSAAGIKPRPVAINLSARQLEQKDFPKTVRDAIGAHGIDPALIKFEITESMLMRKPDEVVGILESLDELGVKLSVDDFGTGYSSLGYLKRFPLHELKIDRSFVQDVVVDADSAAIVVAMIELAHNLQLRVVAEGVETRAQLQFLRTHGCDEMQGYYFSRPVPAHDCAAILSTDRRAEIPTSGEEENAPSLLIVDDSSLDLELMSRALAPLGYEVLFARTAREALTQLAQNNVIAVISDQNMPTTKGVTLMNSVRGLYPNVVRILMSGIGTTETITEGVNTAGIHKFLNKNWSSERIVSEVHEALQRSRAA